MTSRYYLSLTLLLEQELWAVRLNAAKRDSQVAVAQPDD
jgi:hypothetical protein